jgi:hypothetical protein
MLLGKKAGFGLKNGKYNTFIGDSAGASSVGTANVFIGYNTGANELGDNKLYIANSNTATPLIYGDFANIRLKFNSNVQVIGTAFHIYRGASGASINPLASAIFEDSDSNYIQFLTPNTKETGFLMGDPQSSASGFIIYSHVDNAMHFQAGGLESYNFTSSGKLESLLTTGNPPIGFKQPSALGTAGALLGYLKATIGGTSVRLPYYAP